MQLLYKQEKLLTSHPQAGPACLASLSHGNCAMQDKGQERLVPKLPKNIGWSMGTELRESHYLLSPKNAASVQRGMIFHISLGAAR